MIKKQASEEFINTQDAAQQMKTAVRSREI